VGSSCCFRTGPHPTPHTRWAPPAVHTLGTCLRCVLFLGGASFFWCFCCLVDLGGCVLWSTALALGGWWFVCGSCSWVPHHVKRRSSTGSFANSCRAICLIGVTNRPWRMVSIAWVFAHPVQSAKGNLFH